MTESIMNETSSGELPRPTRKIMTRNKRRSIFFGCMVFVPLLLFVIFYGVINLESLIMAFKKYSIAEEGVGYIESFAGLDNFKVVLQMLTSDENWKMITNSILLWAVKLVIGLPVTVLFSFYVYKKRCVSGFFRIILFLPNVISNLIMVYLFRFFANDAIKAIFDMELGLLQNVKTEFVTILFFNLWLGFAGQTLIFTSAMSGINEAVVESAQIDGITPLRELWYITVPMIFSTFSTFLVLGLTTLFIDQMSLVTFYDKFNVPVRMKTIGYYLYEQALLSNVLPDTSWVQDHANGKLSFAELSAFGLLITVIVVPLSLGARKLLDKYGPSAE